MIAAAPDATASAAEPPSSAAILFSNTSSVGLSDVRKYFLHLSVQNGLLHAGCSGIHKRMSDRSVLLLHQLPDPAAPVLREAVMSQI